MRIRRRIESAALLSLAAGFLALPSGCRSQKPTDHDPGALDASSDVATGADQSADQGADQGADQSADQGADTVASGAIWTAQSSAIDISCAGLFEGTKRIRATRDQLSDSQLAMLSGLTLIPPKECVFDQILCQIQITAADGTVAKYQADQSDVGCGTTALVVSYEALDAFMQSLPCSYPNQQIVLPDAGQSIPSVVPDARCFNGVLLFAPAVARLLVVDDPSIPRHLELDACNGNGRSPDQVHPQLMAPDGQTLLSAGTTVFAPGSDGTCWRLDYTFTAAGTYQLNIGLDQGAVTEDVLLRYY